MKPWEMAGIVARMMREEISCQLSVVGCQCAWEDLNPTLSQKKGKDEAPSLMLTRLSYQTRQAGFRTIGAPGLQPKALAKSGMFDTTPFTR